MNSLQLKFITLLVVLLITPPVKSGWFSSVSLPDESVLELIEKGPEWIPKPYKIPIEQGTLLNQKNLDRLKTGLSREQVKFLLGSPIISDTFHSEQWDYIFYSRKKGSFSTPKNITIIFANEKVREIYSQGELVTKLGEDKKQDAFIDGPIAPRFDEAYESSLQEIIISKREDFLTATRINKLPVCIDEEYESYDAQKTLVGADEDTLEVRSDEQNQDEQGIFYATGNVEIERAEDLVKSDKAQFNAGTGVLEAEGNVKYLTEDLTLYASKGGYNSQNDTVAFSSTTYHFPSQDRPGKGKSEDIFIDNEGIVHLTPSSYTTCSLNNPDWEFDSTKTILYREDDRGHAYNIFLKYKGVPVLYSPFISFPLSKKRHSGFLLPFVGSQGESGTVISAPYYLNLAENFDLTFKPTSFSGRGLMLEGEFRHKSNYSESVLELANMEKDDVYGKSRHAYSVRDNRIYTNTLKQNNAKWEGTLIRSNLNAGGISDLSYFDDFGNTVSRIGRTHITRNFLLEKIDYGDFGYFKSSIGATDFQLAKTGLNEQYSIFPRIRVDYNNIKKDRSFNYNFNGEFAFFDHTMPNKATGVRTMLYPSVEYPITEPGWELVPKVGIKHVDYRLDANASGLVREEISNSTPILSLKGKMIYERIAGNNILQTLEPEMYFLYIPAGNQDDNPIFDSGNTDFKYNLFAENKFYGHDKLNDAKQMTLALSSSMINTKTGNELIRGTIGQIFYLDDRSVNLNNSTTSHSDSSNIMGIVNAKFKDYWRLSGYTEFNPHDGHGQKNQIRLSYKKPYGKQNKIFNTSYRFERGTQEEIDISGVLPFNSRTSLIGKVNYSFNNRRSKTEDVLERMIGIEYESCCYGIKFVIREYWNGTKKDDALYFEFLPKGIATSSNTTAELLREGILGYQDKFEY